MKPLSSLSSLGTEDTLFNGIGLKSHALINPGLSLPLGTDEPTKTDEFSEKFRGGGRGGGVIFNPNTPPGAKFIPNYPPQITIYSKFFTVTVTVSVGVLNGK